MVKCFYYTRKWFYWAYGGGSVLVLSLWIQVQLTQRAVNSATHLEIYPASQKQSQHTPKTRLKTTQPI